ncbi:MAG: tRNA dihydrouridine synthase, partial [Chordicoccus sp.]
MKERTMYTNEISIGGVRIPNRLVLGPMAGVTDRPFRTICHELGAGLVSMEMVSANAVKYGNKKTFDLIHIDPSEHPISMQLFGPDPDTMVLAAKALDEVPYDILDVNMGCPMPKIVNNGEGSALMKNPETAAAIIRELVHFQSGKSRPADAKQSGTGASFGPRPVTVKIRAGFDRSHLNAVELAERLAEAGAAAIAVHGRTREQYYTGQADWDVIRRVKEAV